MKLDWCNFYVHIVLNQEKRGMQSLILISQLKPISRILTVKLNSIRICICYTLCLFQELQKIIKIFFDYIRNSNEKIKNVVIPPLGHGFWGFPDDVIAKNMISTIVELGKDSQIHHVSIKVVCHRREHSVFKVRK